MAGVADVPVGKSRQVDAFVATVGKAALASRHYRLAVAANRLIDQADSAEGDATGLRRR